jgi:predicted nuclease of predicted toxin-antitoxin system
MSPKFHKFKLLLDENMPGRRAFATLNHLFDVKHIALDLKQDGIRDEAVYQEAVNLQRLIVTFNGDDFKPYVAKSRQTGIIAVSDNLTTSRIDSKLVALLLRSSPKTLYGKLTPLTGET